MTDFAAIEATTEQSNPSDNAPTDLILTDDVELLCQLGDKHCEHGDWIGAKSCYRKALSLCDEEHRTTIEMALGEVLRQLGELDDAVALLTTALESNPGLFAALLSLGKALMDLKRPHEAAQAFARAVAADGSQAEPHFRLGQAFLSLGLLPPAEMAFRNVVHLRPEAIAYEAIGRILIDLDRRHELPCLLADWESATPDDSRLIHARAAWAYTEAPSRASDNYVRDVFDNFAEKFDETLNLLDYCAPELLVNALKSYGAISGRLVDVLDAGCGTGLCGPLLRPLAKHLAGVDLSSRMLEQASCLGVYDSLTEAELTQYLLDHPASFDVVLSADTLVYFGDLAPVFQAAEVALRCTGILIFSLEHFEDTMSIEDYRLGEHGRYAHAEIGVLRQLEATGLDCLHIKRQSFRKEAGLPVPGLMVVAKKRSSNCAK